MHNMKAYEEVETELHSFMTSALDADEKSASHPSRFTPRTRAIITQWIGRLHEPQSQSRLETLEESLAPNQNWTMILAQSRSKLLHQPHHPSPSVYNSCYLILSLNIL
jgi:hypothetical protein